MTGRMRVLVDRAVVSVAERFTETSPLEPWPGWRFGDAPKSARATMRKLIWKVGGIARVERPVTIRWYNDLLIDQQLGSDLSRCLYVGGAFEPNELSFVADTLSTGAVFVDVGANEGLYTALAATIVGHAGRVFAVEPSGRERRRLESHIDRNGLRNVTIVPCALDAESGTATLRLAESRHAGQNTLGDFAYEGVTQAGVEIVPTCTLDQLVSDHSLDHVDLVKIDVEGNETRVLTGASTTLETLRPTLVLEVQDPSLRARGSSRADLLAQLSRWEYDVLPFSHRDGRPTRSRPVDETDLNVVAVPRERP